VGPAFTYWSDCINTSLHLWTEAVDRECGNNKTCFDNIYDALNAEPGQDCGIDNQSYESGVCIYDNFWLLEKVLSIQYAATWGKREVKDRNKRWLEATRTVLEKRQAGFVNVVGHGTRNSTTMLAWTQDGNLVASQNGTLFATLGGNVIGDTNGRFLHYYELWMGEAEVSRLRLADLDMMPVGSVLVLVPPLSPMQKFGRDFADLCLVIRSLAPMDITGLASPALVAFTSSGAYYYIITCTITGQLPKLFLTSDISLGIEELVAPGVQDTLTGGVVEECGLLPWSI
jgi:hypothetical protein